MGKELSRRTLLRGAAGTALASPVALSTAKTSQERNDRLKDVEKQLAQRLTPDVEKLTSAALASVQRASATRIKTKLPENSEPCFIYIAPVKSK